MNSEIKNSGIRDNHLRGTVADFLVEKISDGSALSVVSAYFTIYAYEALGEKLDSVGSLRFLFGEVIALVLTTQLQGFFLSRGNHHA